MALLKISHWERLPREPGTRREPFLSLTGGNESTRVWTGAPSPGLRHRLCLGTEAQETDGDPRQRGGRLRPRVLRTERQLVPGSEAERSVK